MRDELLQLAAAGKQKALAATVKTEAPGIHRMAFQVSGTMTYGSGEPQPFTRILNFEVPVGSAPDPAKGAGDEIARPKRAKARKPDKH
jgi:hypothetical protein